MNYVPFTISAITQVVPEVFVVQLKPKAGSVFPFTPGQFAAITNPAYVRPAEPHYFSIASSPQVHNQIEFCFRVFGNWTQSFSQKKVGDELMISGPLGNFTWKDGQPGVFLAGGVGIAPFMSMLRTFAATQKNPALTLLYGSRMSDTIVYKVELDELVIKIPSLKVVHILSDVFPTDAWPGERGFMSGEFVKKYVDLAAAPHFYLCGPPIFIKKMHEVLAQLAIAATQISAEQFTGSES